MRWRDQRKRTTKRKRKRKEREEGSTLQERWGAKGDSMAESEWEMEQQKRKKT